MISGSCWGLGMEGGQRSEDRLQLEPGRGLAAQPLAKRRAGRAITPYPLHQSLHSTVPHIYLAGPRPYPGRPKSSMTCPLAVASRAAAT